MNTGTFNLRFSIRELFVYTQTTFPPCRHVILPPDLAKHVPKAHLMTETEWRNLGVQQSPGWVHYMVHAPEPHVILFRRKRIPAEDAPQVAAANAAQAIANLCG